MKYFLNIEGVRNRDIVEKFPKDKNEVSNWNNGWSKPNIFQLQRLSEITGKSLEDLIERFKKLKK